MELAFKKIAKEGSDFSFKHEDVEFFGRVAKAAHSMVLLKAKMRGKLEHLCDRCGDDLGLEIDEDIEILINDGIYKGEIEEFDVVEVTDGLINFDEILQSEIEAYKSDYHYCDKCKNL